MIVYDGWQRMANVCAVHGGKRVRRDLVLLNAPQSRINKIFLQKQLILMDSLSKNNRSY